MEVVEHVVVMEMVGGTEALMVAAVKAVAMVAAEQGVVLQAVKATVEARMVGREVALQVEGVAVATAEKEVEAMEYRGRSRSA